MHKRSARQIRHLTATPTQPATSSWPASSHHIFQYLHLLTALDLSPQPTPPRLEILAPELEAMKAQLGSPWKEAPFWLGLNPGAEYGPAKRWTEDRFVQTAAILHRQYHCGWMLFGGSADVPLAQRIQQALSAQQIGPILNLAGQTTLRELGASMSLCRAILTNDTGPMHLAAAVGTPVVALFGSTSPELTGPKVGQGPDDPHQILRIPTPCAPCYRRECPIDLRCLIRLQPKQAAQALQQAARL